MGANKMDDKLGAKFTVEREGCHFRIVAAREFWCHDKFIKRGSRGGLIDNEHNLSQGGTCWITKDACVYGNARIEGDALITDCAIVCANAIVRGNAVIQDDCQICGSSIVQGNVVISGAIELVNTKIGKDITEYFNKDKHLIQDAKLTFNPTLGKLSINNYSGKNNLNVNIKTVLINGHDKREDESEEQYRNRKMKEHKNTYIQFCRIVGI